jgi:hypothetical protein
LDGGGVGGSGGGGRKRCSYFLKFSGGKMFPENTKISLFFKTLVVTKKNL